MQGSIMKENTRKIVRLIAAIALVISLGILAVYLIGDIRDARIAKQLEDLKNSEAALPDVLDEYAALVEENPDTIGWLKIDGTPIDYVVMQTPKDANKYLHADFYGNYSYRGCLILDDRCDVLRSDNLTIFGHNMKDGSMFGDLLYYKDKSYYEQHKIISFDSIYEKHTYEVIAAIYTKIPGNEVEAFRYYRYSGIDDKEMFEQYKQFIKENREYETGVELQDGDKILTLSTCAYHTDNGRFIVVARQIT